MKKILYTICILALSSVISCDKIDPDEYVVFAGAVGEWIDGNGVADKSQRAFLEKYTGPKCPNCPDADAIISTASEKYGDKFLAVSIHDSSYFGLPLGDIDMRTEDGNTWSKYFGISAYPRALINRNQINGSWDLFPPTSSFDDRIDNVLAQDAQVALEIKAAKANNEIDIIVDIEHLTTITDELTVTLMIVEDGIIAPQSMPDHSTDADYEHNHILRDVITDIWGAEIETSGTQGVKRTATFKYTPENVIDINNCHIIGFVSTEETRQILNCAGSPII